MEPMYLGEVENAEPRGPQAAGIRQMREAGVPVPQILHLFAFKPENTRFLEQFTQGVMRGPSPLTPGQRELIAAFTSQRNRCLF
jgi:alkylhydroperoxidase family enzyme